MLFSYKALLILYAQMNAHGAIKALASLEIVHCPLSRPFFSSQLAFSTNILMWIPFLFLLKCPFKTKLSYASVPTISQHSVLNKMLAEALPQQRRLGASDIGVQTPFGPSNITKTATSTGTVQQQVNTTDLLSRYRHSYHDSYVNLHCVPQAVTFSNLLTCMPFRDPI